MGTGCGAIAEFTGDGFQVAQAGGRMEREAPAKISNVRLWNRFNARWFLSENNHGTFGRWTFLEITDPWNAKKDIRAFLDNRVGADQ